LKQIYNDKGFGKNTFLKYELGRKSSKLGDENSSPLNVLNKHSPLLQELEIGVPSISALGR